jgi:manganese transport system permease protein
MDFASFFLEPLGYEFMARALAVTVIAALVCALLSCWLVLIGWSLMGDAVSHAVLPGVVLAYIIGAPFAVGAVVFGVLAVALIGIVRNTSRVKEDAAMGIVFTTLFALGLVLISVTPSQTDLNHIIFGNLLGVSRSDLAQIGILSGIVLTALVLKRRDFILYAFDPTHAHAIGLSPKLLGAALLGLLALTSVAALQMVGVILVVAMLIIPGATAYLLTNRFRTMLVIAPSISVVCSVAGLYLSYYLDTASGGMVVLAQGAAFAVVYLFSPQHGVLGRRITMARRRRRLTGTSFRNCRLGAHQAILPQLAPQQSPSASSPLGRRTTSKAGEVPPDRRGIDNEDRDAREAEEVRPGSSVRVLSGSSKSQ